MKNMLLHVCCAPCSTHAIEELRKENNITLFFYNPNIEPIKEYELRFKEAERYSEEMKIPLIVVDYGNTEWHEFVKGFEQEKEGGKRCKLCFRFRLEKTAQYAKDNNFDAFTTALTVSPYKNMEIINKIGKDLAEKYNIEFLENDFKKNNGYFKSIELSKKHNIYRQNYCGCVFSRRN